VKAYPLLAEVLVLGVPVAVVNTTMLPKEVKTLCSEVEEGLLNDMLKIGRNTKRSTKKKEGSEHVFK
jgi:hypothetical protein